MRKRLLHTADELSSCRKRLKMSLQQTRRLRSKIISMQSLLTDLQNKKMLSQQAADTISSSFSGPAMELVKRCINKGSGTYPPELKAFALTLQFYSARAYEYVRKTFGKNLPHPKTVSNWYSCVNGNPGFHDEVLSALKIKAESSGRLQCSLMMDEVAIRKQLDYDRSRDKFVGYVDLGVELDDTASLPLANEALVFLIVCLTDSWKMPVAYFLIAGLHGIERANLIKLCVTKLHDVGVDVVSLTFDGCSANCSAAQQLGVSFDVSNPQPTFENPCDPNSKICVFLDVCHMLKLMRNTLADKQILRDTHGKVIMWEHIRKLHELQDKEGLLAANKLNERHVQWNRQKMKVKLAAQTLSSSVADSLFFCQNDLGLPEFSDCAGTIEFLRVIDHLFDVLNSRNPLAKGYKAPLRLQNESCWRPFLMYACDYLRGLKLSNGQPVHQSLRKTGVISFVLSISSVCVLFDTLVRQQATLHYLLTYKYSQDHLELFFSLVRSRGGSNNNPSPLQLQATWKRLLTHNQVKDIATGNCEPQDHCQLLFLAETPPKSTIRQVHVPWHIDVDNTISSTDTADHDYMPSMKSLSCYVDNVVFYIAGFVARAVCEHIRCTLCQAALVSEKDCENVYRRDICLFAIKDRGGLYMPSDDVVAVCKIAERSVRAVTGEDKRLLLKRAVKARIVIHAMSDAIGCGVFSCLREHAFDTGFDDNHQVVLMKLVTEKYVTLRLYS